MVAIPTLPFWCMRTLSKLLVVKCKCSPVAPKFGGADAPSPSNTICDTSLALPLSKCATVPFVEKTCNALSGLAVPTPTLEVGLICIPRFESIN